MNGLHHGRRNDAFAVVGLLLLALMFLRRVL